MSDVVAIPPATEKVLVPYDLKIGQHGAEAEDSQDTAQNELRRILATTGL